MGVGGAKRLGEKDGVAVGKSVTVDTAQTLLSNSAGLRHLEAISCDDI